MSPVAIQESTHRMLAGSIISTICLSLMRKLSPEYLSNLSEITGLIRGSAFKPRSDCDSPPTASCRLPRLLLNLSSLSLLGTAGHHWAPQRKGVDGSPGEGNSHDIIHKEVEIESYGKLTATYPGGCHRGKRQLGPHQLRNRLGKSESSSDDFSYLQRTARRMLETTVKSAA